MAYQMKRTVLSLLTVSCALFATTGFAANYYNCATDTGCVVAGSTSVTTTYAKTRYPLVFANGMLGFNQIGPLNYWYGIPADLTKNGAQVYITKETALNSSDVRGEQLLEQVQNIIAITNNPKVNLIGHSHGGQSIRYVAGVKPQLVASASSVSSPHKGSPVADLISTFSTTIDSGSGPVSILASSVFNGFGMLINAFSGGGNYQQDSLAGMNSLTTAGATAFNQRFPQGVPTTACGQGASVVNGVRYYSWSGTKVLTNPLDPIDGGLGLTSLAFLGSANDGLVGNCSSHLGQVIRDNYGMNHLDSVNQAFGLVYLFETNPKTVFRDQANRLKNAGL